MRMVVGLVALLGATFAGCGGGGGSGGSAAPSTSTSPAPAPSPSTTPSPSTSPAPGPSAGTVSISTSTGAAARLVSALATGTFPNGVAAFDSSTLVGGQVVNGSNGDIHLVRYGPTNVAAWTRTIGGAATEACQGLAGCSNGFLAAAGTKRGAVTFGAGQANQTTLAAPAGDTDGWVALHSSGDGYFNWARQVAGSGHAQPAAVSSGVSTVDVVGSFFALNFTGQGTVTLGPGEPAQTTFTTPSNASCVFVARLDFVTGALHAAWEIRSTSVVSSTHLASSTDGRIYVAGHFSGDATFAPGLASQRTLTAVGARDGFLACYRGDGTLEWVERLRPAPTREALAIDVAALPGGGVVVCGGFGGQVTLRQGQADERTLLANAGGDDALLARYTAAGALVWARAIGGAGFDRAYTLCAFAGGQVGVAGDFHGPATFGPGEPSATTLQGTGNFDVFVARHEGSDGALAWATWVSNPDANIQTAGQASLRALAAQPDGTSSLVGNRSGSVGLVFGPGEPRQTTVIGGFLGRHR